MNKALLVAVALLLVLVAPAGASATPPSNDNFGNAETIIDRFGWVDGRQHRGDEGARRAESRREPGRSLGLVQLDGSELGPSDLEPLLRGVRLAVGGVRGRRRRPAPTGRGRRQRLWRTELADVHGERRCDVQDRRRRRERCHGLLRARLGPRADRTTTSLRPTSSRRQRNNHRRQPLVRRWSPASRSTVRTGLPRSGTAGRPPRPGRPRSSSATASSTRWSRSTPVRPSMG